MDTKQVSKDVEKMTEVLFTLVNPEFKSEREIRAVLKNCKKFTSFKKYCRNRVQISIELNGITYYPSSVANKVATYFAESWWRERERLLTE